MNCNFSSWAKAERIFNCEGVTYAKEIDLFGALSKKTKQSKSLIRFWIAAFLRKVADYIYPSISSNGSVVRN